MDLAGGANKWIYLVIVTQIKCIDMYMYIISVHLYVVHNTALSGVSNANAQNA